MIVHILVVLIVVISLRKPQFLKKHNRKTIQTRVMVPILRKMSKGRNKNVHVYSTFFREIQELLVKKLFLINLEVFISSREINLYRLDTFPIMVANI